jgi:hypothetical protein
MKLAKQSGRSLQYALSQNELDLLCHLLKKFPYTEVVPTTISKTDADPKSFEREKLLNESMAEHRKELQRQAVNLITGNKLKKSKRRHLLTLTAEDREIMLQILNDIRVGCWHSLGKPESLELHKPDCSPQELRFHSLMNLAGYFQHHLIGSK